MLVADATAAAVVVVAVAGFSLMNTYECATVAPYTTYMCTRIYRLPFRSQRTPNARYALNKTNYNVDMIIKWLVIAVNLQH